ncbi:MAG TPA: pyruvate synthase [Alphaproteobacteria bacterium]|nr:pyruvate synthase [Alphaproteobacteria bacterium]
MIRQMLTGNSAAAWGARLADVDYVPAFPITPQTEIIETLAQWCADGTMAGRFVTLDSEHSMLTAAGAAAATGVRVFTATSSQGLLYAFELLYTVAGWRVPLVLVNVSRALASPITLEPDHNDVLAARDSGFLQIHAETCQEVLDSVLMAYRIAEDPRVLLPAIVNLDGFYLSFTREPVTLPAPEQVRAFLPAYAPTHAAFKASRPMAQGVAVLGGALYSYFKYQMHLAAQNALAVHEEVAEEFAAIFGRRYGLIETYHMDDADYVLVMSNAFATKGKAAVNRFRDQGIRMGLLRLRMLRPFPKAAIVAALRGRKAVAVLDQNLSVGFGGITYAEIASALYGEPQPPLLLSYIGGLGGKDLSAAEFDHIVRDIQDSVSRGETPPPRLLYTDREAEQMAAFQRLAGKGEVA